MNPTFTITVMAGYDGGRIVYETVVADEYGTPDSRLVFGGNIDETSKYVAERIAKMAEGGEQPAPRQIEAPVKIRVRRTKEPQPIDVLEALEIAEDVG